MVKNGCDQSCHQSCDCISRMNRCNKLIFLHAGTNSGKLKVDSADLDGSELVQVWNIAHHFYLSPCRPVENFTLEEMFLDVRYKNCISEGVRLNATHINCT